MQQTLTSVYCMYIQYPYIYMSNKTRNAYCYSNIRLLFNHIHILKKNTNKKKTTLSDASCKMVCFITITLIKQLTKA